MVRVADSPSALQLGHPHAHPARHDAAAVLEQVAATFRARDVPFMWLHRPSDEPADLGIRLSSLGLDLAEMGTGMDLELDAYEPQPNRSTAQLVDAGDDDEHLRNYEELIRTYWAVPEEQRSLIQMLNRHWTGERNPGTRLVAYIDGQPIGKLFMNTQELPDRVSIYGVAVRPEARGQGVARALMDEALARAKGLGARRCILHSSAMALPMYQKMGFVARCDLPVYATAPLFGTHHH